jgi:hypothetical protein
MGKLEMASWPVQVVSDQVEEKKLSGPMAA